jgi:hypothetical protein
MAGARDLVILTVPLDVALVEYPLNVGKTTIAVGKMDGPFRIRVGGPAADRGWVETPVTIEDENCELIDLIYITAAAVPGGIIELWCSNSTSVVNP